jgi:NAD(P)-dependent dehydrogenase (short-subunit alcohol dehydrogenase family)
MTQDLPTSPVILVLGAAGGIGQVLCRRLASQGVRLVLAGRNESSVLSLARESDAGRGLRFNVVAPGLVDTPLAPARPRNR